jgi:hypothetical protein
LAISTLTNGICRQNQNGCGGKRTIEWSKNLTDTKAWARKGCSRRSAGGSVYRQVSQEISILSLRVVPKGATGWPAEFDLVCRWYAPHLERLYEDAKTREADLVQLAQSPRPTQIESGFSPN